MEYSGINNNPIEYMTPPHATRPIQPICCCPTIQMPTLQTCLFAASTSLSITQTGSAKSYSTVFVPSHTSLVTSAVGYPARTQDSKWCTFKPVGAAVAPFLFGELRNDDVGDSE